MGLTWTEPETAAKWVRQVRSQTDGLFQVNFVLHFEPKALTAVLEAGAPIITFSWGLPIDQAKAVKDAGAMLGIQVVSQRGAKVALELEPDFLICQGVEAGGHVQSSTPLKELLPQVLEVAGDVPVIAAGGISVGHQIRSILDDGAAGAMLVTRFVATQESRAHPTYKRILAEIQPI
jgi:nitronate monooxygenase